MIVLEPRPVCCFYPTLKCVDSCLWMCRAVVQKGVCSLRQIALRKFLSSFRVLSPSLPLDATFAEHIYSKTTVFPVAYKTHKDVKQIAQCMCERSSDRPVFLRARKKKSLEREYWLQHHFFHMFSIFFSASSSWRRFVLANTLSDNSECVAVVSTTEPWRISDPTFRTEIVTIPAVLEFSCDGHCLVGSHDSFGSSHRKSTRPTLPILCFSRSPSHAVVRFSSNCAPFH